MKKRIIIPLALLVIGITSIFFYLRFVQSPLYSLKLASDAVANRDWESFQKYVDVDALASQIVEEAASLALEESGSEDLGDFGEALFEGFVELAKPALKSEIKEIIREDVESGRFQEAEEEPDLLSVIFASRSAEVQINGKIAKVTLSTDSYKAVLRMRKKDGYWQLFAIDNLREIAEKEGLGLKPLR